LRFEFANKDQEFYQPVGTVNYPNDHSFTRITEQKYLSGQTTPHTTLVYEFPQTYQPGANEAHYPIPRQENHHKYAQYQKEIGKLKTVLFAGRLADYKYYNMDQACARALKLFEDTIAP
jgi:UDP-galactopyranose mutase